MQLSLYDYWITVYSRKSLILIVGVSSCIFALIISLILPPVYEAKAVFYMPFEMKPNQVTQTATQATPTPLLPLPEEKATGVNIGIIKSKDIARAVQKQFPQKSIDFFKKNVDFVAGRGFMIEVFVRDRDPHLAADIANAFPIAYDKFHTAALVERSRSRETALSEELKRITDQLIQARINLQRYKEQNASLASEDELKKFDQELKVTQANMVASRERIKKIQQQLAEEKQNYTPDEAVVSTPQIESLKQNIANLEIALARPSAELKPTHPRYKELQIELTSARQALNKEISRLVNSQSKQPGSLYETLRHELIQQVNGLKYLEAKAQALSYTIDGLKDNITRSVNKVMTLEVRQNEEKRLETLRLKTEDELQTVIMQAQYPSSNIVFVEHAYPPAKPTFPRPILNALVALILGLASGCYYVLLLNYLNQLKRERIRKNVRSQINGEINGR